MSIQAIQSARTTWIGTLLRFAPPLVKSHVISLQLIYVLGHTFLPFAPNRIGWPFKFCTTLFSAAEWTSTYQDAFLP